MDSYDTGKTAVAAAGSTAVKRKVAWSSYAARFRELGLLFFIVLLCMIIQLRNPSFLTWDNIQDLVNNTAILSILSVGMMMVIITRGIDLSVGAILALSGMISAMTVSEYPGTPPMLALLLGTVIGIVCGSIIGFLVSKMDLLPIIATLGMMNVYRGMTYLISDGSWVSAHQMSEAFKKLGTGTWLGISYLVWFAVLVYVIAYYFITHTRTGRQIYAVGSNPEAARISGIQMNRILWLVYAIMGGLSGMAGVLWVAKFASAQGDTATGYELSVIAACVVGGVSIAGGVGKLSGVLLGAILLGIINNALPLINVSPFWQMGIQGTIILAAVLINAVIKRGVDRTHLMRRNI